MKKKQGYLIVGIIALFLVALNSLFAYISPEEIVKTIGVENTYLVVLAISVIGGLSTLTGPALFTAIATFSAGGSNPLLLALAGGSGIFISDSIFYFLILYGRKSAPHSWEKHLDKIEDWIRRHSPKVILSGVYVYLSFTPLPNDLLRAALVVGGYKYKRIWPVLLAGSFTVALVTAYVGGLVLAF